MFDNLKYNIGDRIPMYFELRGLVSTEEIEIIDISEKTISLYRGDDESWLFNMETGECLNDNNFLGAKRTIEPINNIENKCDYDYNMIIEDSYGNHIKTINAHIFQGMSICYENEGCLTIIQDGSRLKFVDCLGFTEEFTESLLNEIGVSIISGFKTIDKCICKDTKIKIYGKDGFRDYSEVCEECGKSKE